MRRLQILRRIVLPQAMRVILPPTGNETISMLKNTSLVIVLGAVFDLLFEAHSSVLDLVFYEADQFPPEYKGQAFVALKGSWNRSQPTGYKVVRVPFKDGRPEGYYENFATGFWASGEHRAEVWGRPAALAVAKDGALLIADDANGTIWRIAYTGKP